MRNKFQVFANPLIFEDDEDSNNQKYLITGRGITEMRFKKPFLGKRRYFNDNEEEGYFYKFPSARGIQEMRFKRSL